MLAVQMVATHEAALECFRRAALSEQTFAGRELGLKYADKLVRSFAALTDALNRHRGKGQQLVRVEHVHVHPGGQAIVGAVTQGGEGATRKVRINPMHPDPSPMNRSQRCGARTRCGRPCRSPAVNGRKRCRMHGGAIGSGARAGNTNALKHGRYSREMLEFRRAVRELLREKPRSSSWCEEVHARGMTGRPPGEDKVVIGGPRRSSAAPRATDPLVHACSAES